MFLQFHYNNIKIKNIRFTIKYLFSTQHLFMCSSENSIMQKNE